MLTVRNNIVTRLMSIVEIDAGYASQIPPASRSFDC